MVQEQPDVVTFRYTKSAHSRIIRADGIYGGLTHRAEVYGAMFTETPPIPSEVSHPLESGKLGAEARRAIDEVIEREVQVEFTMSLDAARAFRNWMSAKIEEAERLTSEHDQN
jgi:hypothetical protein